MQTEVRTFTLMDLQVLPLTTLYMCAPRNFLHKKKNLYVSGLMGFRTRNKMLNLTFLKTQRDYRD